MIRSFKILIVCLFIAAMFAGGAVYYLAATTSGSEFLLRQALHYRRDFRAYGYQQAEGSLLETFTVTGLVIKDLQGLPSGNECRIEQLKVSVPSLRKFTEPVVTATNGVLKLPGSHDVLFYGAYTRGMLDLQAAASRLNSSSFSGLLASYSKELERVEASIEQLQVHCSGPVDKLRLNGTFVLTESSYRIFQLRGVEVSFDLTANPGNAQPFLYGDVLLESGTFSGPKGAALGIQPSRITFNGVPEEGILEVIAKTQVDEYTITANLDGTVKTPELSLRSEPELSKEQILLLLATGKSIKSLKDIIKESIRSYK